MVALDAFATAIMLLLGLIAGAVAISLASAFGMNGWIFTPSFILILLFLIYVYDQLRDFGTGGLVRIIARIFGADMNEIEREEEAERRRNGVDYLSFLAGALLGVCATLIWSPDEILNVLL